MAFPVVAARATGRTTTTNTSSHAITLPSGITAGDLLVVVFACDGDPTISVDTGASGGGWNALTQGANGSTVSSNVFWKIAAGGDALTLTTSAAEQSSHASFRITGGYSVSGTSANGSSTNSNPPSHSGPDGAQDYLWIATRAGDSTVVATAAPSSYTDLQTLAAAGTGGASVNTAERSLNASSTDPGTFTSGSEQWVAFTLAVSPIPPPITGSASGTLDLTGSATGTVSGGGGGDATATFNVLVQGGSLDSMTNVVTGAITVTEGRPVVAVFADCGGDPTSSTPHTLSGAGQTWVEIYGAPIAGDDSPYVRMSIWVSDAASGGSGALTFGTDNITTHAFAVFEIEPSPGATVALGTEIEGTTAEASTSNSVSLTEADYWIGISGASKYSAYGSLSVEPRSGWTEVAEQVYLESMWLVGVHAQMSPSGGDTHASVTWSQSVNIPLIAIPIILTGGGDGGATGTGAGDLPLSGSGTATAEARGQGGGTLPLGGSGQGQAPALGAGAGTLPLSGSATGVAEARGQGAGDLPLGGSGQGQAPAAGQGAGSLPLSGSGMGTAEARGTVGGTLPLGGTGQGHSPTAGQGAGSLPLSGSGTGTVEARGQGAGDLPLSGSGTAVTGNSALGTGAGVLPLGGSGTGKADAKGQGSGALPLAGSGQGQSPAAGQGAGSLTLSGSGTGKVETRGQGAGALPLAGSGTGTTRAAGQGAGDLPLGGSGQAAAPASGSGSGVLPLTGSGTGQTGAFADYTTGRLAFASAKPRTGAFLTQVRRKGRVLNPTRRGKIMEID